MLQAYPFQETQMSSKIQDKSLQNRPDELSVLDNLLIDMLLSLSAKGIDKPVTYPVNNVCKNDVCCFLDFPKVAEVSKIPRTKMVCHCSNL